MQLKTYSIVVAIAALSAGSSFAYADGGSTRTLFTTAPFTSSVRGAFVDSLNLSHGAPSLIGASLTNVAMTFRSFNYTRKGMSASLPTGPFELKFAGTNMTDGQNSRYGDITAAPIPKPETLGMLLASLSLMTVIALRRSIKANAG